LHPCASAGKLSPARPAERFLEALVGGLGVGDGGFAHQGFGFGRADGCQAAVYLGVDAAKKEGGYRGDSCQIPTVRGKLIQPQDVRLGNGVIMGQRKHQGDIDVNAFADQRLNRRDAGRSRRHFDHHVRPFHSRVQAPGFGDSTGCIVGQSWTDLQADIAILAIGPIVDGTEQIGRVLDIFNSQGLIDRHG